MSPFTVSIPAIHCSPLLQPPYFLTPPPSSTESSPSSATSPCLSDHSSIPRFKSPTMAGPPIKSFTQKMLEPVARPRSKPVKYAPFAVSTPEITAQERQLLIHKLAKYRVQQYSDGDRAIDDLHYSVPYSGEKSKPTLAEMTGKKQLDFFAYTFVMPDAPHTRWDIMWDYETGLVRTKSVYKALDYDKAKPADTFKATPGLSELAVNITGGRIDIQGFWLPYDCALALFKRFAYKLRFVLFPLFGPEILHDCVKITKSTQVSWRIFSTAIHKSQQKLPIRVNTSATKLVRPAKSIRVSQNFKSTRVASHRVQKPAITPDSSDSSSCCSPEPDAVSSWSGAYSPGRDDKNIHPALLSPPCTEYPSDDSAGKLQSKRKLGAASASNHQTSKRLRAEASDRSGGASHDTAKTSYKTPATSLRSASVKLPVKLPLKKCRSTMDMPDSYDPSVNLTGFPARQAPATMSSSSPSWLQVVLTGNHTEKSRPRCPFACCGTTHAEHPSTLGTSSKSKAATDSTTTRPFAVQARTSLPSVSVDMTVEVAAARALLTLAAGKDIGAWRKSTR